MKTKWVEIGVNVCDRPVRNWLNKWDLPTEKTKQKQALTHKQKKIRLKQVKEKQSQYMDNWMKVIFSDE